METTDVKAQYYATIKDGKILGLCQATPPAELRENQIMLSKDEFYFLKAIDSNLPKAYDLIKAVLQKVEANNH
jgi:hypothetical protein